ncbi:hypothetical protein DRO26_04265 [Candidatus Bathyarchaeota archaeon]|nr:MAG: hypothetical protein DRO26_04265 [Candidatus Bathyarchaeota archaeon]
MSYSFGVYGPVTKETVNSLVKIGVDAVFTEPKKEFVKNAKEAGLKVYACIWVFKTPNDNVQFGVENVYGEKVFWAGSGCPNNPKIREYSIQRVKEAVNLDVTGLVLDGVRFPSLGGGLSAFLTCFCEKCQRKSKEFGLNLTHIKDHLKSFNLHNLPDFSKFLTGLLHSNIQELKDWLTFRCKSITEYVLDVKSMVKEVDSKVEVGAALFTPSLALLVGQNYGELCRILDFIQPMVYHRGDGLACINYELGRFVEECFKNEEEQIEALKILYQTLTFGSFTLPLKINDLIRLGFPLETVEKEFLKAKSSMVEGWSKLTPILFIADLDTDGIREVIKIARELKPDGTVYFAYNENLEKAFLG